MSGGAARRGFLDAFRYPSYRYQWPSDLLASWATEMEVLILGWFVLVTTDSPVALAVLGALHYGGSLLCPYFGVLADRIDRRNMLIAMRLAYAALASMVMLLGLLGEVQAWQIFLIAGLSGLLKPSDLLMRNALTADIVPVESLRNALSLTRSTMESARVVGALMGAALLSVLGIGAAYGAVVGFYLASAVCAGGISVRRTRPPSTVKPWVEFKLGLGYVRRDATLTSVMCLAVLVNLTALPISHGLLPVLARDLYAVDENGLARLSAAFAFGALAGALMMASALGGNRPGRTMLVHTVIWHLMILVLAGIGEFLPGLLVILVMGVLQSFSMISMSVLLLALTDEAFRGRVFGVRMLAVYALPVGLVLGGFLIERYGVAFTFTTYGIAGLVMIAAVVARWPALLRQ